MQILMAALIAALVMAQYLLWIDREGVQQIYASRLSVQVQTEQNTALNERNRALEADIKDLKTGLVAIEERARSEIGMIRRDETFYRLLDQPKAKSVPQERIPRSVRSNPLNPTATSSMSPKQDAAQLTPVPPIPEVTTTANPAHPSRW
jgi:cell division protein FtsB